MVGRWSQMTGGEPSEKASRDQGQCELHLRFFSRFVAQIMLDSDCRLIFSTHHRRGPMRQRRRLPTFQ